jgi:nucleoside-diphosphate-sugar epimerase
MRRVLVTGATGGLGRNAVDALLAQGIEVLATGRNADIGTQLAAQGVRFFACDLSKRCDEQLQAMMLGVDTVWHCAALSSPWGRRSDFIAANITATQSVLRAAAMAGVARFVHVSTPAIYFDYQHRYSVEESFQPQQYANDYAATKAQAEQLVQRAALQHPSMHCSILRPRAIFGPYDQTLLPRLMGAIKAGVLRLPRGGDAVLDMTYAGNVVHAMCLASTIEGYASGTVFNISNHEPLPLKSVLKQLFDVELKRAIRIESVPYSVLFGLAKTLQVAAYFTAKEPLLTPYSVGTLNFDMTLDNTLAQQQLGYQPLTTMSDSIARTAIWLMAQEQNQRQLHHG